MRAGALSQSNRFVFGSSAKGLGVTMTTSGLTATVNGKFFGTAYAPATTNEWVHIALVNAGGTSTFYVNGVPSGTTNAATLTSAFYEWTIGINSDITSGFIGGIDDYRIFTFTNGGFVTNDLMYSAEATGQPVHNAAPEALQQRGLFRFWLRSERQPRDA